MRLTRYSVKQKIATSIIATALVVLGLYGLINLPLNFLPDMTYPLIKVHIWWPGATPEEIDRQIADPIERQMATVDGLDFLESSSIEGMYTLSANFKYGAKIDVAYQDATAAMARIARQLPKDIDPPVIIKADPSQQPVAQLTISSDEMDLVKLRTWTEDVLQDKLVAISGVAGTDIAGGMKREIRINLDPVAIQKYDLSLPVIIKKMAQENIEQFGGRVTEGPREFIARTVGEYKTLDEIRSIVLVDTPRGKVYLKDVARVEDSHAEVRVSTRLGGKPCLKISILKQADANTVEVARAVSEKIKALQPSFPADVKIRTVENQADYVEAALNGVRNTAIEAAVLVIFTIYLFLGSWRQVAVMVLALPLTLIINFVLMKLAGFSLNIFSLSGLVVAVGVALDNSIVVIENITRLKYHPHSGNMEEISIQATSMVGQALVAATISFLALFLPFLLVPGLTSLLFKELILVIAGILLISLIMAITVTPMLSAVLMSERKEKKSSRFENLFEKVIEYYGQILDRTLQYRWVVIGTAGAILVGAGLLISQLGSEFLPRMDDGRIMVKVKLRTGASLSQTDEVLRKIEAKLAGDQTIATMFTLAGGKVWGLYTYEIPTEGEVDLQLVPRDKRKISTADYIKKIRPLIAQVPVPGGKAIVSPMKVRGMRSLGESDIEVQIRGQDIHKLFDMAKMVSGTMNEQKNFTNVYISLDLNKPEYQIKVDRVRAAELGVSVADVATAVKTLINGSIATRYRDGDRQYDMRILVPEKDIRSRYEVENLSILPVQGRYLQLRDVAKVVPAAGPVEIIRYNQTKQVIVRGDAAGTSVGQALQALQAALKKVDVPPGYEIAFGGQAQMMKEMQMNVLLIMAFAVFFSFVVLAVQFNSLKLPGLILVGLPLCLVGLILALWVTGTPMGATVIIGALVVVAANINGGVLLIALAEEMRLKEHHSVSQSIIEASKIRLRPRLMVYFMIITGLIPLALNLESGGEMLQPMAISAIGGLIGVMLVSLFLIPCLYLTVTKNNDRPETGQKGETT